MVFIERPIIKKENFLGEGKEKKVYRVNDKNDLVVADYKIKGFREISPHFFKAIFYFQKILYLLFPNNLPNIHYSSIKDKKFSTISNFIHTDETHNRLRDSLNNSFSDNPNLNSEENFKRLCRYNQELSKELDEKKTVWIEKMRELGILFDIGVSNFTLSRDGNIIYLDNFFPWVVFSNTDEPLRSNFDVEKMKTAIDNISDENKRKKAQNYLSRLLDLTKKETERLI